MKKFTHALIACKAVERLKTVALSDQNKPFADYLISWFADHKDGVIRGAWYPDDVIGDKSTSHVLKHTPESGLAGFRQHEPIAEGAYALPSTSLEQQIGRSSVLYDQPFAVDPGTNLPERCEALSHAVIDNLRIREREAKGSPLTPTDNHVALLLFMLSHYIADAHMPMHCDARKDDFPGFNIHAAAEEYWEREVVAFYKIDRPNQRFVYNESGFPLLVEAPAYKDSILKAVQDELDRREFRIGYGGENDNVREYILSVCRYSYLTSYSWLPSGVDVTSIDHKKLECPTGLPFRQVSIAALADAIDAVSRVWLHDLRRFIWWKETANTEQ